MTTFRRQGRVAALLLTAALFLTACGGDDGDRAADPTEPSPASDAGEDAASGDVSADAAAEVSFPVTVAASNGEVEVPARPERIVSLSPTATEMLFAIGAGDQVIAADSYSNFPADAPTTELSAFEPNVEAIAEYEPDLVVAAYDPGDLVAGLDQLDIPTIVHPSATSLDDTFSQMEQLGVATGHVGDAAEAVAGLQTEIDEIVAEVPEFEQAPTYYHELDSTHYSATSDTFIGEVYGLFGLENIADAAEGAADAGGYPQLSAEYIIEADPDLIFLASAASGEVTAESVGERPGWGGITAVETGNVVEVDADITSRWGPRIVEFLELVGEQVAQLEAAGAAS